MTHPYDEYLLSEDGLEEYIRSLRWSDQATDTEKTLVAGNLRGFAAKLRRCPERTDVHGRCELERGHEGVHYNALHEAFQVNL